MKINRKIEVFIILLLFTFCSYAYAGQYHGHRRKETLSGITEPKAKKTEKPAPIIQTISPGPKKLIAIADFENRSNWTGQINLGSGMAEQLITALMNTGRFVVVERKNIEAIMREQNFGISSHTAESETAKIGEISKAQIFIQGSITEFDQTIAQKGSRAFLVAGVAVDIRIFDINTSQILASKSCRGISKLPGSIHKYSKDKWEFRPGEEARAPLDYAVRDAITQAVNFIALELKKLPWEGRIAMVKDNYIYINCGRIAGINIGDQFSVYKTCEVITDPDTGFNLGSEKKYIGRIEIIKVEEKYSKAESIEGANFERDNIIKYEGHKTTIQPSPTYEPTASTAPPIITKHKVPQQTSTIAVYNGRVNVQSLMEPEKQVTVPAFKKVSITPWESSMATVTGTGVLSENILGTETLAKAVSTSEIQAIGTGDTKDMAINNAYNNLAVKIMNIPISADTKEEKQIADILEEKPKLCEILYGYIFKAKIISTETIDNKIKVVAQLPLSIIGIIIQQPLPPMPSIVKPITMKEYTDIFGTQARATTQRAAQLDGYRKLAEIMYGIVIKTDTTLKDLAIKNSRITKTVEGMVKGAEIIDTQYYSDGSITAAMKISPIILRSEATKFTGDIFGINYFPSPKIIDINDFSNYKDYLK